jgi:uncharacterized caspase-like protein
MTGRVSPRPAGLRLRWLQLLALTFFCVSPGFGQTAADPGEARIALVIGNGAYSNAPLKNSTNDARDIAAALQKVGFTVTLLVDADFAAMNRAVRDFGNAIRRPDAVALFYFSGHGVQYRGANYLVPAKADIQDADELSYLALNAEQVYAKMESAGARTNIVILDACRNNPFPGAERAADRGLAVVGNVQPPQSLIVYATAPGKTAQDGEGRNGVFTGALLKHLADPNLDVELMIRRVREDVMAATSGAQVPWHSSSISGTGFTFVRAPIAVSAPAAPAASPAAVPEAATKTTGTLSLTSDPPGIQVTVDDGDFVETPLTIELEPGSHSFEVKQTIINRMFYDAQPKQWVAITAGSSIAVPLKAQAMMTSLAIRFVPPGYMVFVNDEKVGVTPLGEISVKAGWLQVRFEKQGEPARSLSVTALPDRKNTVAWGQTELTPIQLERRPIRLDGKADSWSGIEPLYEWSGSSSSVFMGQPGAGIARVYMCRDEKNLYWRLDFDNSNPLRKVPPGVKKGIVVQFSVKIEARKQLNIGLTFDPWANQVSSWMGIWDEAKASGTNLGNNVLAFNNANTMLAVSVPLDRFIKYCTGPVRCEVGLANESDGHWEPGSIRTEGWYVDFTW